MNPLSANDISIAMSWMWLGADTEAKREAGRGLIRDGLRRSQADHGLPPEGDLDSEDELAHTILAHCLECWNDYDISEQIDEREQCLLNNLPVTGTINSKGCNYVDGITPQYEIRILLKDSERVPAIHRSRVPILLEIDGSRYDAGLIWSGKNKYINICPDLKDSSGIPTTLGSVLHSHKYTPNQKLNLFVVRKSILIRRQS